jgi:hypothetical protein
MLVVVLCLSFSLSVCLSPLLFFIYPNPNPKSSHHLRQSITLILFILSLPVGSDVEVEPEDPPVLQVSSAPEWGFSSSAPKWGTSSNASCSTSGWVPSYTHSELIGVGKSALQKINAKSAIDWEESASSGLGLGLGSGLGSGLVLGSGVGVRIRVRVRVGFRIRVRVRVRVGVSNPKLKPCW